MTIFLPDVMCPAVCGMKTVLVEFENANTSRETVKSEKHTPK